MAEEVRLTDYDAGVSEWEDGLPNGDDLTSLSQSLISLELLSAFNITPEPYRSVIDVNRASQKTLSDLRGDSEHPSLTRVNGLKPCIRNKGEEAVDLTPGGSDYRKLNRIGSGGDGYSDDDSDYRKLQRIGSGGVETANLALGGSDYRKLQRVGSGGDGYGDGGVEIANLALGGSDYRKLHRIGSSGDGYGDGGVETVDLDLGGDGDGDVDGGGAVEETETETETETVTEYDLQVDDPSTRASKRPRLVWTPQLHKRFIDVVAHLGDKSAVPKTIMQLMNVEGLTRENVASHLQKYRLYLKRMQDVPQRLHDSGGGGGGSGYRPAPAAVPMTYRQQMVNHMAYNMDSVYQHGNSNCIGNSVTPNNK